MATFKSFLLFWVSIFLAGKYWRIKRFISVRMVWLLTPILMAHVQGLFQTFSANEKNFPTDFGKISKGLTDEHPMRSTQVNPLLVQSFCSYKYANIQTQNNYLNKTVRILKWDRSMLTDELFGSILVSCNRTGQMKSIIKLYHYIS